MPIPPFFCKLFFSYFCSIFKSLFNAWYSSSNREEPLKVQPLQSRSTSKVGSVNWEEEEVFFTLTALLRKTCRLTRKRRDRGNTQESRTMPVEIKCRDDIIKLPDIASLRALKKQWNVPNEGPLTNRDDYVRLLLNFYDRMGAPANNKVRRRQKIVIHILINKFDRSVI